MIISQSFNILRKVVKK